MEGLLAVVHSTLYSVFCAAIFHVCYIGMGRQAYFDDGVLSLILCVPCVQILPPPICLDVSDRDSHTS